MNLCGNVVVVGNTIVLLLLLIMYKYSYLSIAITSAIFLACVCYVHLPNNAKFIAAKKLKLQREHYKQVSNTCMLYCCGANPFHNANYD